MSAPRPNSIRRVAVTARVDPVPGRDEVRDAVDVRLGALLTELGFAPFVLSSGAALGPDSDPAAYLAVLAPDAVVLSGGNDIGSAPARDALERAALDYAAEHGCPVLGICRGAQMINTYLGGSLRPGEGHVATRHRIQGELAEGRPTVNSYHNHVIASDGLGRELEVLALAEDGTIEALRHRTHPWYGILWHPERDDPVADADRALIQQLLGGTL